MENDWESMELKGIIPPPIFGHSIIMVSKTKVLLFGGAFEVEGKVIMSNSIYLYSVYQGGWKKIERKVSVYYSYQCSTNT